MEKTGIKIVIDLEAGKRIKMISHLIYSFNNILGPVSLLI